MLRMKSYRKHGSTGVIIISVEGGAKYNNHLISTSAVASFPASIELAAADTVIALMESSIIFWTCAGVSPEPPPACLNCAVVAYWTIWNVLFALTDEGNKRYSISVHWIIAIVSPLRKVLRKWK